MGFTALTSACQSIIQGLHRTYCCKGIRGEVVDYLMMIDAQAVAGGACRSGYRPWDADLTGSIDGAFNRGATVHMPVRF